MAVSSNGNGKWKQITVDVQLPSGNVATLRPLGFDLVFRQARIPDFMTPMIVKAFKGEDASDSFKIDELEQTYEFFDFLDRLCELAFVRPRIVKENPGEGEITCEQIDFEDKAAVMNMIGKPPSWLAMFRPGQEADVVALDDEQDLPDTTEQAAETEVTPEA
jgi:hypothetical protein